MTRGIYAFIVLGALCGQSLLGTNAAQTPSTQSSEKRFVPAQTVTKQHIMRVSNRVEIPSTGPLPGIVEPARRVELLAPVDGVLDRINVQEGQFIKAGQTLAQFDDKLSQATVQVAEAATGKADIELAQVDQRLAEAELERLLSVTDRRALSQVEIDRARGAVERAKATVNRAKQLNRQAVHAVEVERQRLQLLHLKAPFDGVVVRISTQPGASLVRSTPIITVANLDQLRVELFAALEHFDFLTPGENYELKATAPIDGTVVARLISREPVIDPATKTFRCVFEIENTERLPAGFTVLFAGKTAVEQIALHRPAPRSHLP